MYKSSREKSRQYYGQHSIVRYQIAAYSVVANLKLWVKAPNLYLCWLIEKKDFLLFCLFACLPVCLFALFF